MKKKEVVLLIVLILVTIAVRSISLEKEYFFGADSYYHYSVIEQSKESGFSSANSLDMCYSGVNYGHPEGFYLLPFLLSFVFGSWFAFGFSSVIIAALTVLLLYFLLERLFNQKIAFIASFLVAGLNAHIARSTALIYKGDNLILPLVLLSLLMGWLFIEKKSYLFAILTGLFSGLSAYFWTGYPIVIVIVDFAVFLSLFYVYFSKNKFKNEIILSVLMLAVQLIVVKLVGSKFITVFSEFHKTTLMYYITIPLISILLIMWLFKHISNEKTIIKWIPLFIAVAAFGIVALFKFQQIQFLINGFGLVKAQNIFTQSIQELKPTTLSYLWFHVWLALVFVIIGLIPFFKKLNKNKVYILGLILPFVYMMFMSKRYVFFASIPLMILASFGIVGILSNVKNKRVWLTFVILILIVNGMYGVIATSKYFMPRANENLIEGLEFLENQTDGCVIATWDKGGMIQSYSKKNTYASSVSLPVERIAKINQYLLSSETESFDVEDIYVLTTEEDFLQIISMQTLTDVETISGSLVSQVKSTDEKIYFQSDANGRSFVIDIKEDSFEAYEIFEGVKLPMKLIINTEDLYYYDKIEGDCLYIGHRLSGHFNSELCGSNLVKMVSGLDVEGFENIYFKNGVSVYSEV
jgi:asparagine N-glycosylation enzyme membrane subunit Stt3